LMRGEKELLHHCKGDSYQDRKRETSGEKEKGVAKKLRKGIRIYQKSAERGIIREISGGDGPRRGSYDQPSSIPRGEKGKDHVFSVSCFAKRGKTVFIISARGGKGFFPILGGEHEISERSLQRRKINFVKKKKGKEILSV